ncbi:hypothetical protein BV898_08869 [Hypsibius exemplaris]|uniref:Chitin-binding type-3 domain-containing protein n=1 Tax=Hypsibius exemplaris TaxID=2072580 RepID=A0A1W0WP69_HYPEX|nr:hypothetical protein BV898_08869 [Hypsibius exemplaris]
MLFKAAFLLTLVVVMVSGRPQAEVPNPTVVMVEISTGKPMIIVPAEISVIGEASSSSDFNANGITSQQVNKPNQLVVMEEGPIVSLSDTTTTAEPTAAITEAFTTTRAPIDTTLLATFTEIAPRQPSRRLGDWQRGASYNVGDEVTFNGATYRALQSHIAEGVDWTPLQTPALWTKLEI